MLTTFTTTQLTDNEQLVLALVGARDTTGFDTYGKLAHPHFDGFGSFFEAFVSLDRFGLIERKAWRKAGDTRQFVLTEKGEEYYAVIQKRASRYSECPGCVLLPCVCSHKLGCLSVSDPLAPAYNGHQYVLGCTGTHD